MLTRAKNLMVDWLFSRCQACQFSHLWCALITANNSKDRLNLSSKTLCCSESPSGSKQGNWIRTHTPGVSTQLKWTMTGNTHWTRLQSAIRGYFIKNKTWLGVCRPNQCSSRLTLSTRIRWLPHTIEILLFRLWAPSNKCTRVCKCLWNLCTN